MSTMPKVSEPRRWRSHWLVINSDLKFLTGKKVVWRKKVKKGLLSVEIVLFSILKFYNFKNRANLWIPIILYETLVQYFFNMYYLE